MTIRYVKKSSTPSSPYTTEAGAANTFAQVMAVMVNGDTCIVKGETSAGVPDFFNELLDVTVLNTTWISHGAVISRNASDCCYASASGVTFDGFNAEVTGVQTGRHCFFTNSATTTYRNCHAIGSAQGYHQQIGATSTVYENCVAVNQTLHGFRLGDTGINGIIRNCTADVPLGNGFLVNAATGHLICDCIATNCLIGYNTATAAITNFRRNVGFGNGTDFAGTAPVENVNFVTGSDPKFASTTRGNYSLNSDSPFLGGLANGGKWGATIALPDGVRPHQRGANHEAIALLTTGTTKYSIRSTTSISGDTSSAAGLTYDSTAPEAWRFTGAGTAETVTTPTAGISLGSSKLLWVSASTVQQRDIGGNAEGTVDQDNSAGSYSEQYRIKTGTGATPGAPDTVETYGRIINSGSGQTSSDLYARIERTLRKDGIS